MQNILLVFFIFVMIGVFLDVRDRKVREDKKSKEEPLEDYLTRITKDKLDEAIKKADEIARENGVD